MTHLNKHIINESFITVLYYKEFCLIASLPDTQLAIEYGCYQDQSCSLIATLYNNKRPTFHFFSSSYMYTDTIHSFNFSWPQEMLVTTGTSISLQLRTRRVLTIYKNVLLRTRRALLLYKLHDVNAFWFPTEHRWTVLTPFWFSFDFFHHIPIRYIASTTVCPKE